MFRNMFFFLLLLSALFTMPPASNNTRSVLANFGAEAHVGRSPDVLCRSVRLPSHSQVVSLWVSKHYSVTRIP